MKALDQLENRLVEHWQRKESRKTWQEWIKWLEQIQCPLRVDRPEKVSSGDRINYQTFLQFCETALARLPDCESNLTTPNLVEAHSLCLLSNSRQNAVLPRLQNNCFVVEQLFLFWYMMRHNFSSWFVSNTFESKHHHHKAHSKKY